MGDFERYQSVAIGCVGGRKNSPVGNDMSPVGTFGERRGHIQRKGIAKQEQLGVSVSPVYVAEIQQGDLGNKDLRVANIEVVTEARELYPSQKGAPE